MRFAKQEALEKQARVEEEAVRRRQFYLAGQLADLQEHGKRYEQLKKEKQVQRKLRESNSCLLYTSPSPRDRG